MSLTPLSLENYFFTRVHAEANLEYATQAEGEPGQQEIDASIKLEVLRHEEDPHRYQITLTVEKVTATEGLLPYDLNIQVVGFLSVDPGFKHDNIDRLVHVNGATMLYAAAREHVLMVTGRGPWGGFQLPTMNFHGAIAAQEHAKESRKAGES